MGVETNETAGEYQLQLFDKKVFNFPKPCSLVKYLLGFLDNGEDAIVLDFFSGSGTTAEAVMQLNQEHNDNHYKFILVQIQEDLDKSIKSIQSKSQQEISQNAIDFLEERKLPHLLTEIGKERIRRAAKKILAEHPEAQGLDTGFRVLKLDSTNMQDVYYAPTEVKQDDLLSQAYNIKPDRTDEDLLFQVMLELGITLDSPIKETTIVGKHVYDVANGFLLACFDDSITDDAITTIAKEYKPTYFVLRDSGYIDDSTAINFEQIFKTYSPNTTLKTL